EHPSIITAKEKIAALQKKLAEEVNAVVASKYTTINPTQAAMIAEQANAQVSMAVAKASEEAIQARKAEKEKELEGFPKDVLEYLNLQRDTGIKEQIYTNLIKQAEDNKLKEAMESMDIQVIDAANLPKIDSLRALRKIIIIIGVILGMFISSIYVVLMYRKNM
ncbi:GNVR domain-containing protein, partial [Selenomonas ruminantium]